MNDIFEIKRNMNKVRPKFHAQDAHKKSKIENRWRKPRGSDSKMKQGLGGYRKVVKQGYMSPKSIKYVNVKSKIMFIVIRNLDEMKKIDPKKEGAIISGTIGQKKKIELIKYAKENSIIIENYDADKFIKKVDEELKKKKEVKEKISKEKKQKEADKKKKAIEKEKEKKEDDLASKVENADEIKAREKKEKDKLLISTE